MAVIYGHQKVIFGIQKQKPLRGFPEGKIKIKLRNTSFAVAYVRNSDGIRQFMIEDTGKHWQPIYEQGSNIRK